MIIIESINTVGLTVSDLEKSIAFYKDLFDFDLIEKLSNAGTAYLKIGEMVLALTENKSFSAHDSGCVVSFFVDEGDFDDAAEELEELQIPIVYGPENIRSGQLLVFTDPDGNRIELAYPKIV
ncbi:MAG: VOC family protein [Spirochaetia bacterium]|jgi:metallothiol transferase|nr:VOC family protein [Spirochaetia bacterium]